MIRDVIDVLFGHKIKQWQFEVGVILIIAIIIYYGFM